MLIYCFVAHTIEIEIFMVCAFPIIFMILNTITELIFNSTPGKGILSLYVASDKNGIPDAGQILIRNIIKFLGIIIVFFIKDDNLLNDRLTNVRVYSKK
jgi:uncharacterized RDD family membrane protein YckC